MEQKVNNDVVKEKAEMFKDKLKERRKELGMSQTELAGRVYLSQQLIAAYELGVRTPGTETLSALADALDCSTDYLLGRTDER